MLKESLSKQLSLYLVAGTPNVPSGKTFVQLVEEAIEGGVSMVQLREKGPGALNGEALIRMAREVQSVCRKCKVPFIINDDVDLMILVDADGLHVGQEDGDLTVIKERIGTEKIFGVSAHTLEEAETAVQKGAHYLGIGPVYPTQSKKDARPVMGTSVIEKLLASGIDVPLVGIGGIDVTNIQSVIRAGASGAAVISAITSAESPLKAAQHLNLEIERALKLSI